MKRKAIQKNEAFTLSTKQALALIRAVPPGTLVFEASSAQGHSARFIGERDDVIRVWSHPAQEACAPAWNEGEGGNTHTLHALSFQHLSWMDDRDEPEDREEFCILLDYNYELEIEGLPRLPRWNSDVPANSLKARSRDRS